MTSLPVGRASGHPFRAALLPIRRAAATVLLGAARTTLNATRDSTAVDLLVTSVLARDDLPPLSNAPAFVRFLRNSLRPDRCALSVIHPDETPDDTPGRRFTTLIDHLTTEMAPLPLEVAVRIGLAEDSLTSRPEPVDFPRFSADVGVLATLASSSARKGRLLSALVRFGHARTVFEIGTGFGMSALFLAQALPDDGRLGTVEFAHPMIELSVALLKEQEAGRVTTYAGSAAELVSQVKRDLGQIDLLFHDGNHSAEVYVADFKAYEPTLAPAALVLYDDIRWEDERFIHGQAHTYEGWREVAQHPRVRAAVEIDHAYGLLLLR